MKVILEKTDVLHILEKSIGMPLSDENVVITEAPFEVHISGVCPPTIQGPPINSSPFVAEAEDEQECGDPPTDYEEDEQGGESLNLPGLFDTHNKPMGLADLLSPENRTVTSCEGADKSSQNRYAAPSLVAALKASEYFSDEGDVGDLQEHLEDPGVPTETELDATRGKATTEELSVTEKRIERAKNGFSPR